MKRLLRPLFYSLLLCLLSVPAFAQYSYIGSTEAFDDATNLSSLSTTSHITVSTGDLIIAVARTRDSGTHQAGAVTDTLGNTYTQRQVVTDSTTSSRKYSVWTAISTGSGTDDLTFAPTGGDDRLGILADQFRSISSYDTSNNANQASPGTGTDAITVSITPGNQPALVYGISVPEITTAAPSAGTGFTSIGIGWSTSNTPFRREHKRVTSTSATAATFTRTPNGRAISFVVTALESGGGGIVVNPISGRGGAAADPVAH